MVQIKIVKIPTCGCITVDKNTMIKANISITMDGPKNNPEIMCTDIAATLTIVQNNIRFASVLRGNILFIFFVIARPKAAAI